MKKILKIFIILFSVIIVFALGFVMVLHIFEYKPDDIVVLEISNNADNLEENYITLETDLKLLTFNTGYASLSETEDFVMDGGEKGRMDSLDEVQANISDIPIQNAVEVVNYFKNGPN